MEKFIEILITIFGSAVFLLFCWCLIMYWKSKNFKKAVRRGDLGMACKYWDYKGETHYSTVEAYMPHSDKVIITNELIAQPLDNVEPAGSWRT